MPWTDEEICFLKKYHGKIKTKILANHLKKHRCRLTEKANQLKLPKLPIGPRKLFKNGAEHICVSMSPEEISIIKLKCYPNKVSTWMRKVALTTDYIKPHEHSFYSNRQRIDILLSPEQKEIILQKSIDNDCSMSSFIRNSCLQFGV